MSSTLIDRYLHARARAVKAGDRGVVREIDFHLARYGYTPDASERELALVEERAEADVKPRRGRPPGRRNLPPVPPEAA